MDGGQVGTDDLSCSPDCPLESIPIQFGGRSKLPASAQEVQPASGAADPVLHCSHRVCSLHFNNWLVWIGHQTGQEQTTTDSRGCRNDYWCRPAHHPGPVHLQSQENGQGKSLQTPHTLDIICSNSSPLAGATDLCTPKPPDTGTVFPPCRHSNEQLTNDYFVLLYYILYLFI